MVVSEIREKRGNRMLITREEQILLWQEGTGVMLRELQVAVHRNGYQLLVFLVPDYARDGGQSMTKELYPRAAEQLGHASWQAVEHSVRNTIADAWKRRDPAVWERYFPGLKKPPSNKQFIATLAERLKNAPPENGRGERLPRGCLTLA